jgi:rubrerythrin
METNNKKELQDEIKKLQNAVKELQDMAEAILLAIPREREAHEYYENTSREATSETSRKMYSYLAEQEKQHETTLRKRLDELQQEIVDTKIKLELERMKLKGERGG